jgi:excisionase family DNA binding protein
MLHVSYTGLKHAVLRYHCKGAHVNHGADWCVSFGGLRTDESVAKEVLEAIGGNAIQAALEVAKQMRQDQQQRRKTVELDLEQARYEARLASRRYEAVDPENRLVAAELEARWNACLQRAAELQAKLDRFDRESDCSPVPDQDILLSLAQDLPAIWNSSATDMRLKQRIIRILVHEIVADVDDVTSEIVLLLHWAGGRHSELRIKKNALGKHRRCTSVEAIEAIRAMAGKFSDQQIAATLNRLGLRTGAEHTWTEARVRSARQYHGFPSCASSETSSDMLTMQAAAERLGVSPKTIRRMIEQHQLPATQVVPCAPWQIRADVLDVHEIRKAVEHIKSRVRIPRARSVEQQGSMFSEM